MAMIRKWIQKKIPSKINDIDYIDYSGVSSGC